MDDKILKGKWNQLKDRVGQKWDRFTQDEVDAINGETEKLYKKLQEKYDYTKDQAKEAADKAIQEWDNLTK